MASHLSSIGMSVDTEEDFLRLAQRVSQDADEFPVSGGSYFRWSSPCGAQLWLQVDGDEELIGMAPHFAGPSRIRVGLTAEAQRDEDSPLDGAFFGWAEPSEEDPEQGTYPFLVDLPNARLCSELEFPCIAEVQIAAFAFEVTSYATVAEYEAAETDFASRSFVPVGLFGSESEDPESPQAYALITGHVAQAEARQNALTGETYYWVALDALGGTFDAVIDTELLDQLPEVGGVLSGVFWLSGLLVRPDSPSS